MPLTNEQLGKIVRCAKVLQHNLNECRKLEQELVPVFKRIQALGDLTPKDSFGDDLTDEEIQKQFDNAIRAYDKLESKLMEKNPTDKDIES